MQKVEHNIHKVAYDLCVQIFEGIFFQEQSDFSSSTQCISTRVWEDFEFTVFGIGAENVLDWVGILLSLWSDRGDMNLVGDQEAGIESQSKRSNEIACVHSIRAFCFGQEFGSARFRKCSLAPPISLTGSKLTGKVYLRDWR